MVLMCGEIHRRDKKLSAKLLMLLAVCGFTFIVNGEGWSKDWRLFQATRSGNIYYFDPESIEKLPGGVVQIWVKMEETEIAGDDLRKHVNEVISGRKDRIKGEVIKLLEMNPMDHV